MLNVNLFPKEQLGNQVSSMKETLLLERTSNLPIEKAVFNQPFNISLNSTHNFYNFAYTCWTSQTAFTSKWKYVTHLTDLSQALKLVDYRTLLCTNAIKTTLAAMNLPFEQEAILYDHNNVLKLFKQNSVLIQFE